MMKHKRQRPQRESIVDLHQKRIAERTLKMPDAIVGVLGGMTKEQARKILGK